MPLPLPEPIPRPQPLPVRKPPVPGAAPDLSALLPLLQGAFGAGNQNAQPPSSRAPPIQYGKLGLPPPSLPDLASLPLPGVDLQARLQSLASNGLFL